MPEKIKIIIDTNWWVSFIVSRKTGELPQFFFNDDLIFCFSQELSNEISETLTYPRLAKRINEKNLQAFTFFKQELAKFYIITSIINICRDPKDNFLLALSKDANADYLITRDEDLLTLKKFENTLIVTLPEFIEIISTKI